MDILIQNNLLCALFASEVSKYHSTGLKMLNSCQKIETHYQFGLKFLYNNLQKLLLQVQTEYFILSLYLNPSG